MRGGVERYQFPVNEYGYVDVPPEEEEEAFNACLQDVIDNPRYYLDNLDRIKEFKVSWLYYGSKQNCKRLGRTFAHCAPKNTSFKKLSSPNDIEL